MNKKSYVSLMAIVITVAALFAPASYAQTKPAATATTAKASASSLLAALPQSDVVMFADVNRILNDALPRALSSDKAKLDQINREIDDFKTRYGIDARQFDRVAVGLRFNNRGERIVTTDIVALAQGRFNAAAMIAAARIALKGKYQEEKYGGSTIYTFDISDRVKLLGLLNMRISKVSAVALDSGTLALGDIEVVRAAIDAHGGRGRLGAELISLATSRPNVLMGFAANVPKYVTQSVDLNNEEITKSISAIRQAYGSVGMTAGGFDMLMIARTEQPEQAQNLSDSFAALKQFSSFIIAQLPADKGKLAENVIDNLKVTTIGKDLQISLEIAQTDLATLVRIF